MTSDFAQIEALQMELECQPIQEVATILFADSEPISRRLAAIFVIASSTLDIDDKARLLIQCLNNPHNGILKTAIYALSQVPHQSVPAALRPFLAHHNIDLRSEALRALGMLGDEQIVPECVRLLREGEQFDRVAALVSLGALGSGEAVQELLSYWHSSPISEDDQILTALLLVKQDVRVGEAFLQQKLHSANNWTIDIVVALARLLNPRGLSELESLLINASVEDKSYIQLCCEDYLDAQSSLDKPWEPSVLAWVQERVKRG